MENDKKKNLIGVVAIAAALGAAIGAMIFIKSKKDNEESLLIDKDTLK
ncbi:MAG: hypothetical protein RR620_04085 [Clostridium sp.]